MKRKVLNIFHISMFCLALAACKDKAKEAETTEAKEVTETTAKAETYVAKLDLSTIKWQGFKPTGSHHGVISLKSGAFDMIDGEIVSGTFIIDMTSIVDLDIPANDEGNAKLVGHLKGPDFFDVEQHPTSKFEITGVEEINEKTILSGNLTLKNITNNISFPISIDQNVDVVTLKSETFTIDRSKWNVKYGSKSFFDNLGDKFINDDIELTISIMAIKS